MIELRKPTVEEIARIYGENEHVVVAVDGEPRAWAAFREVDGRLWGMFGILGDAAPQTWRRIFYAFRTHLKERRQRLYVLARDESAERLIRLSNFTPTHEVYAEKRVWLWSPHN